MKVTKMVREYIEEQVQAKIEPRYSGQKQEAEYRQNMVDRIREEAAQAAAQAYREVIKQVSNDYDFLEINIDKVDENIVNDYRVRQIIEKKSNDCFAWRANCLKEVDKIVKNIVVTLELGGNKADLDRMLNEI